MYSTGISQILGMHYGQMGRSGDSYNLSISNRSRVVHYSLTTHEIWVGRGKRLRNSKLDATFYHPRLRTSHLTRVTVRRSPKYFSVQQTSPAIAPPSDPSTSAAVVAIASSTELPGAPASASPSEQAITAQAAVPAAAIGAEPVALEANTSESVELSASSSAQTASETMMTQAKQPAPKESSPVEDAGVQAPGEVGGPPPIVTVAVANESSDVISAVDVSGEDKGAMAEKIKEKEVEEPVPAETSTAPQPQVSLTSFSISLLLCSWYYYRSCLEMAVRAWVV